MLYWPYLNQVREVTAVKERQVGSIVLEPKASTTTIHAVFYINLPRSLRFASLKPIQVLLGPCLEAAKQLLLSVPQSAVSTS